MYGYGRGWRGGWRGSYYPVGPGPVPVWRPEEHRVPEGSVPLSMLPAGARGRVAAILAGWRATQRLMSMGITPGVVVEVVENRMEYPWTPVIVRVGGVEVALGRGLASKVYVVVESSPGGPGAPS